MRPDVREPSSQIEQPLFLVGREKYVVPRLGFGERAHIAHLRVTLLTDSFQPVRKTRRMIAHPLGASLDEKRSVFRECRLPNRDLLLVGGRSSARRIPERGVSPREIGAGALKRPQ